MQTDSSFDIVSPIRSLCAEAELLELMDKIVTECQGTKGGSTHTEYEFHVSHETGSFLFAAPLTDKSWPSFSLQHLSKSGQGC